MALYRFTSISLAWAVLLILCCQARAEEPGAKHPAHEGLAGLNRWLGREEQRQATAKARAQAKRQRQKELAEKERSSNLREFGKNMGYIASMARGIKPDSPLSRKLAKDPAALIGWPVDGYYYEGTFTPARDKALRFNGTHLEVVTTAMDKNDWRPVHRVGVFTGDDVLWTYRWRPKPEVSIPLSEARSPAAQKKLFDALGSSQTSAKKIRGVKKSFDRWIRRNTPFKVRIRNLFKRYRATIGGKLRRTRSFVTSRARALGAPARQGGKGR